MKKVTKKEAEEWDKELCSGKVTLNEIRERYGLSRIEGGDVRFTDDLSDMPIKSTFTYRDFIEPWKQIGRLKLLLGISIAANVICFLVSAIKNFL